MLTYYKFLMRFVNEDKAIGDLARDARDDVTFPKRATKKQTIKEYLVDYGACDSAMACFEKAFSLYKEDKMPRFYKERPDLRKIINIWLKNNPGLMLKDIVGKRSVRIEPIGRRLYMTAGIKKQAEKMLQENND